jgi:hypothetical protein
MKLSLKYTTKRQMPHGLQKAQKPATRAKEIRLMPKLTIGGVRVTPMKKTGTLVLTTGNQFMPEETSELVEFMTKLAKVKKVAIGAFAPNFSGKQANGGYTAKQIEQLAEERESVLMVSFKPGFPAPYLAFFDPNAKRTSNRTTRKATEYDRK